MFLPKQTFASKRETVSLKLVLQQDNDCKNSDSLIPNLGQGSLNHNGQRECESEKERYSEFGAIHIASNNGMVFKFSICGNVCVGGQN